eukprot:7084038-Ditylum_brightwellii.AAC.1
MVRQAWFELGSKIYFKGLNFGSSSFLLDLKRQLAKCVMLSIASLPNASCMRVALCVVCIVDCSANITALNILLHGSSRSSSAEPGLK